MRVLFFLLALAAVVGVVVLLRERSRPRPKLRSAEERRRARAARQHARARVVLVATNTTWVDEIADALEAVGAEVTLHTDVETLATLVPYAPDVFVVRVEESTPNGFIFAKAIKHTPGLEDAVLLIESRDPNAQEIFAMHAKLEVRADAYVTAREGVGAVVALVRAHIRRTPHA